MQSQHELHRLDLLRQTPDIVLPARAVCDDIVWTKLDLGKHHPTHLAATGATAAAADNG